MSSVLATLFVLALLVLMALAGYRDGLFFSTYALVRNFIAFLCAMTFRDKVAGAIAAVISENAMAKEYFAVLSFALIFAVIFLLARWLKITYTVPNVPSIVLVDRIGGPVVSVLNAVVTTGTVFIFCSMLPFAKFVPGDLGRFQVRVSSLDTGAAMLRVFSRVERCMGGGKHFLLEPETITTDFNNNGRAEPGVDFIDDVNGNGQWDRGWMWEYQNFCEVQPEDVPPEVVE
jgi:hypothetical protein